MVGAFVLITLAIIVLPMLLDGSAESRQRLIANIPEAPGIELKRISVKDLKQQMERMERASATQLPIEEVDEDAFETETEFTLDRNGLPVSWSLQLGSFESKDNATNLRAKLRNANYHSYILHADTSKGETWRVFVGPMLKMSALTALGEEIEGSLNLKGQVVRFRIEDDAGQLGG
jgi:DedD protein